MKECQPLPPCYWSCSSLLLPIHRHHRCCVCVCIISLKCKCDQVRHTCAHRLSLTVASNTSSSCINDANKLKVNFSLSPVECTSLWWSSPAFYLHRKCPGSSLAELPTLSHQRRTFSRYDPYTHTLGLSVASLPPLSVMYLHAALDIHFGLPLLSPPSI